MWETNNKVVLASIAALLFLFLSLSGVFAVRLIDPPTGLYFNNTSSYDGDAKFFVGDTPRISANWSEHVNETIISVFRFNSSDGKFYLASSQPDTNNPCTHNSTSPNCGTFQNQTFNDTWTNYTSYIGPGSAGKYKIRFNITSTWENGSDADNYTEDNITLWGWSEINRSYPRYPAYRTSQNATIVTRITGNLSSWAGISGYPVNFHVNDSSTSGTNFTDENGTAIFRFDEASEGVYNVTFNITDNSTLYYEASGNNQGSLLVTFDNPGVFSTTRNFSAADDNVQFNWTDGNITLKSHVDSLNLVLSNSSTQIAPDYGQDSAGYTVNVYPEYSNDLCFDSGLPFVVKNQSGSYIAETGNLGFNQQTSMSLRSIYRCPPGSYSGNFYVNQSSNGDEKLGILANVSIPIHDQNVLNISSRTATLKHYFEANATDYQSYYFNTSLIENSTGVTLEMSGYGEDYDLFLFNSTGHLRAKSIERGSSDEILDFVPFDSPGMWEMRIYGNSTSVPEDFGSSIYFTVLNSTKKFLDFSSLNVSETGTKEFTIENEYSDELSDVSQSAEIYKVSKFTGTGNSSYSFLVPRFAEKVKFYVDWEDTSGSIDMSVRDPNGNLIGNSTEKSENAGVVNTEMEEFVVYDGSFGKDKEGYWNVTVSQFGGSFGHFVNAKIWLDESKWISSNFTNGYDFNSTGETNSTHPLEVNVTPPEDIVSQQNLLESYYSGRLIYTGSPWKYVIPFELNVNSSGFVVNGSMESLHANFSDDNIGFDRDGDAETLTFKIENTGDYNLTWENTTSEGVLSKGSDNITMDIQWPEQNIPGGSSALMNVTARINTSLTHNNPGIYSGWVFLNTSNSTNSARPFDTFNLSLSLELSDSLNVSISDVKTENGNNVIENTTRNENVTFVHQVSLLRGTLLDDTSGGLGSGITSLYPDNYTSASLFERNYTSESRDLSDGLLLTDSSGASSDLCDGEACYMNTTIPASDLPGGYYTLSLSVEWNGSETESLLSGSGSYGHLIINDTGLDISNPYDDVDDFDNDNEDEKDYYNITVVNYGPVSVSDLDSSISLVSNCDDSDEEGDYIDIDGPEDNCSDSISGNGTEVCKIYWDIELESDGKNVSEDDCEIWISTDERYFGSLYNDSFEINTTSTSSGDSQQSSQGTSCTYGDWENETCGEEDCDDDEMYQTRDLVSGSASACTNTDRCVDMPSYCGAYKISLSLGNETVKLKQGSSAENTVDVENTGSTDLEDLRLNVTGDAPSPWHTSTPVTIDLDSGEEDSFTVNFTTSNISQVDKYELNYTVYNSEVTESVEGELWVEPKDEEGINETYYELKANLTALENKIKELSRSGRNTSSLNKTLIDIKKELQEADSAITNDDYIAAKKNMDNARSLMNSLGMEVEELESQGGGRLIWIIAGIVAIVVIGILAYLLMPPKKGYPQQKGGYDYKKPGRGGPLDTLKSVLEELIDEIKAKLGIKPKHPYNYKGGKKWRPKEKKK